MQTPYLVYPPFTESVCFRFGSHFLDFLLGAFYPLLRLAETRMELSVTIANSPILCLEVSRCYFLPAKISSSNFIAGFRSLVSGSSVSK